MIEAVIGSNLIIGSQGVVSLVIASYAIKGYRRLRSNTLKLFSLAFLFLFLGFAIEVFNNVVMVDIWVTYIMNAFHMLGYVFLGLSHVASVRKEVKEEVAALVFIPTVIMKSLGLYFLLYAAVETTIASMKREHRLALASSIALYLIFLGEFLDLIAIKGVPLALPGVLRFLGFIILLIPLVSVLGTSKKVEVEK